MSDRKQQTPSKVNTSTYLGSAQKRGQSPFARRTWDLNARVASPFRRLADSSRRIPISTPSSTEIQNQRPKAVDAKPDEIMDWITSIKNRAQSILQTEEDEEKRFYEEIEKERRQIEAQNQINTESFDKLKLFLDEERKEIQTIIGQDKQRTPNTLKDLESYAVDTETSVSESDAGQSQEEVFDLSDEPEDLDVLEKQSDDGLFEEEEIDHQATTQQAEDEYDSEGRLKFSDDAQLIHLSSDEEGEDETPHYDPTDFAGNENEEYIPTPQYESMYSHQRYVPNAQEQPRSPEREQREEIVELSDDEGKHFELDDGELSEDQLEYESDALEDEIDTNHSYHEHKTEDHENYEHANFDIHEQGVDKDIESDEAQGNADDEYDNSNFDPNLFNNLEDVPEPYEVIDDDSFNEEEDEESADDLEDEVASEENGDRNDIDEVDEMDISQALQNDELSHFEILASAALSQLPVNEANSHEDNENAKEDENNHTENIEEITDTLKPRDSSTLKIVANVDPDDYVIPGEASNDSVVPDEEDQGLYAHGSDAAKESIVHVDIGENEAVSSQGNETENSVSREIEDKAPNESIHDQEDNEQRVPQEDIQEPVQEYVEEQYYDSDGEPFRSPSHSVFGSLTVDEISAIQEEEDEDEDVETGFYSTTNILGEVDDKNEDDAQVAKEESINQLENDEHNGNFIGSGPKQVHFDSKDDYEAEFQVHVPKVTTSFASFFNINPINDKQSDQSFGEVSDQFTKALKSRETTPLPSEKILNKVDSEEAIRSTIAEKKTEDSTNDLHTNLTSQVEEEADNVLSKALGEDPESFIDKGRVIESKLVNAVTDRNLEAVSQDEVFSSSLGEIADEFVQDVEKNVPAAVNAIKSAADETLDKAVGENAEEFVKDVGNAFISLGEAAERTRSVNDEVFGKSVGEVAEEFATDVQGVVQSLEVPGISYKEADQSIHYDSIEQSVESARNSNTNDLAEDGVDMTGVKASEKVEESVESGITSEESPKKHNSWKDGKLDEDEDNVDDQTSAPEQAPSFPAFEIPEIVGNAMLKAIETAEKIEALGEDFVDDDSKPQVKRSLFNPGLTRKDGNRPILDYTKTAKETPNSSGLKSESEPEKGTRKRKFEDVLDEHERNDDENFRGMFGKVRKFARFVTRELSTTLDSPISDQEIGNKLEDKTRDGVENQSANSDVVENKTAQVENEPSHNFIQSKLDAVGETLVEAENTIEEFTSFVDEQVEDLVEDPVEPAEENVTHIQSSLVVDFASKAEAVADEFGNFVEGQVEELIENPVEPAEANVDDTHTTISDTVAKTEVIAEELGDFIKDKVEELVENSVEPVEENIEPNEPIKETIKMAENIVEDFGGFVEEKVEELVNNPVDPVEGAITNKTTSVGHAISEAENVVKDFEGFVHEEVKELVENPVDDEVDEAPAETSVSQAAEVVGDFGNFVQDQVRVAIEEPVDEMCQTINQPTEPKDEILGKLNDAAHVLEEKVEEVIDNPVTDEPDHATSLEDEAGVENLEARDFEVDEDLAADNMEDSGNNTDKEHGDVIVEKTEDTREEPERGSKTNHNTNEEDLEKQPQLNPDDVNISQAKSPLKKVFDYFFKSSSKNDGLEATAPENDNPTSSPVERPSKRRKKTAVTDFHDHIVMKTRSGKIIGANSDADIADAQDLEQEEEELIDRIAHGEVHTGHVLHELALEHERLEHEHEHGPFNENEQKVEEMETKEETEQKVEELETKEESITDKKSKESNVENPETIKDEKGSKLDNPKQRTRAKKRSRTDGDLDEGSKAVESEKETKATKGKGKKTKALPPPSERKLRSRTK